LMSQPTMWSLDLAQLSDELVATCRQDNPNIAAWSGWPEKRDSFFQKEYRFVARLPSFARLAFWKV
jgi:hypothetical protein